jgi:amino acid transporter
MKKYLGFLKFLLPVLFIAAGPAVKNPAPDLFPNPFGTNPTVESIIYGVINILLSFAFAIAVLFLIIGGYQYMSSGVNAGLAEKGKKTLTNAIIGIVIIVASYTIISIIYRQLS